MPRYAIILIAGSGQRWGSGDKCLLSIREVPIAIYSLEAFILSGLFERYFFVYRDDEQKIQLQAYIQKHFPKYIEIISWISGGKTRYESVFHALQHIAAHAEHESYVFIHDGARPLLNVKNLHQLNQALSTETGATLAHRVTDTTLEVAENTTQRKYLQRDHLWAIETPQAFYFPRLFEDYQRIMAQHAQNYTDDTSLYSGPLKLIENRHLNPKLTYACDLALINYLLSQQKNT